MKKGFGILKLIGSLLAGMAIGGATIAKLKNKVIDSESKRVDKFKNYYNLLNQWLILKNDGKSLEKYFVDNGYKTIAIYGMGEVGNRLYDELKNTSIEVKYGIDKNAGSTYAELEVYDLEDELEDVDVVVVTAVFAFDEIEQELSGTIGMPVISLEDVVFGL